MGFSNFSSLDGTATDLRHLARDFPLGGRPWEYEPRISKGRHGGGEWTRLATNDEPPELPKQPDKPPLETDEKQTPEKRGLPLPAVARLLRLFPLLIELYRALNAERGLVEKEGKRPRTTVAVTTINGEDVYGINSRYVGGPGYRIYPEMDPKYRTYTETDKVAALHYRQILIDKYPEIMRVDNIGLMPNNALAHAEATVLLRAAAKNGGTLTGKTLAVYVDNILCNSCRRVLPYLAYELGNPTVILVDSSRSGVLIHDKAIKELGKL